MKEFKNERTAINPDWEKVRKFPSEKKEKSEKIELFTQFLSVWVQEKPADKE